jgi:alpha-glucosidase
MNLKIEEGKLYYEVFADKYGLIKKSRLGFEFKNQLPLDDSLCIEKVEDTSVNEIWKPVCGTDSAIVNQYNEASIYLKENGKEKRSIIFIMRAYNDGVAFRFKFPENKTNDSLYITAENTEFNFAGNDSAWWIPSNEFAYESLYRKTPLSNIQDANTPLLIQCKYQYQIVLHEAALLDYSEMTLRKNSNDSTSFISALWSEPNGVCAAIKTPFSTPWRCFIMARNPGEILTSHLIQNLNEPSKIKDVSWIKPIKFIGIWWRMHTGKYTWSYGPNHGATTERIKKYIDFAAAHHIQGVLAEGWNQGWETWVPGKEMIQNFCKAYPDFNLEEVMQYARQKNVIFISHHETGGNIPVYEKQMDSAFALCQRLNIHYLKTGYAGTIVPDGHHHHGQFMVQHFQKVVEMAAKYHICLDVHESIKPTGLDRTWPNLLTQEGGRGNEWNATYRATPPNHCAILPFTRFVAGPFDYTPCIFNINHSPEASKRLYCTLSYQLAQLVVFYSPMMMASDMIENYENQPAFHFVEEVPCSWDATVVCNANPGHYVTVARKSKDYWFTGTIVDEQCYLLKIPLSFLDKGKKYVAEIFCDSSETNWETNPQMIEIGLYMVSSNDTVYAAVSKAGGHCMIIKPMNNTDNYHAGNIAVYNQSARSKMSAFKTIKTYGNFSTAHLARGKNVSLKNSYSSQYAAAGKNAITDGLRGAYNYSAGGWQGFEGTDVDATIDLQKQTSVSKISVGFLQSVNDWIFYPQKIEFYISNDGVAYEKVGESTYKTSASERSANKTSIYDFSVVVNKKVAKFIRIKATNIKTCPPWHPGNGKKAWLFCDEIIVE